MTLYQIIDTLKKIALTQPNIRTATDGDVFDAMNSNPSIKYGVFHVTQTTHTEDEQFDNFGLNLFVIDRLEDDDSNRVSVQSTAKQLLSNIIGTFCETFDAEHNNITYQIFTQRFKDLTAGVWATVTFQVLKDYSCAEAYGDGVWRPEISIINNQDISITKNGIYEPSEGFTGFGRVEVSLPYPVILKSGSIALKAGDVGTYKPEAPYDAVTEVEYEVAPNQDKSIYVKDNGIYTVTHDDEYSGLQEVTVEVAIPLQTNSIEINDNGTYTVFPDNDHLAMTEVEVNVNLPIEGIKDVTYTSSGMYQIRPEAGVALEGVNVNVMAGKVNPLEVGMSFGMSVFESLPDVFYFPEVINLTVTVSANTFMYNMFYQCRNLNNISFMNDVNTINVTLTRSKCTFFYATFDYCSNLKDITPLGNIQYNIIDNRTGYYKTQPFTFSFDYMLNDTIVEDLSPLNRFFDCIDASGIDYNFELGTHCFASKALKRFELDCDFSRCTSYYTMLADNTPIEYICELDATNVTGGYQPLNVIQSTSKMITTLTYFGGFRNQKLSIDNTYFLTKCPNLTRESCLAIVNNLYDFVGHGETPASGQGKLKVHANFLTALGDDVNIATSRGWVITT